MMLDYSDELRKKNQLVAYAFPLKGRAGAGVAEEGYDFFIATVTLFRKSDSAMWLKFMEDNLECIRVCV